MVGLKRRLLAIIEQHQTPQTAPLVPVLMMALSAMPEEEVAEMVGWMRSLLDGLETDGRIGGAAGC